MAVHGGALVQNVSGPTRNTGSPGRRVTTDTGTNTFLWWLFDSPGVSKKIPRKALHP